MICPPEQYLVRGTPYLQIQDNYQKGGSRWVTWKSTHLICSWRDDLWINQCSNCSDQATGNGFGGLKLSFIQLTNGHYLVIRTFKYNIGNIITPNMLDA